MTATERRRRFIRFLENHGFAYPRLTQVAVRASGIRRAEALALLTMEGGRNVFGCDHGPCPDRPPFCHQKVTATRLARLLLSRFSNGVGPTQLTFKGFLDRTPEPSDPDVLQDRMREVGLTWAALPGLNLIKGFSIFQTYRRQGASTWEAARRYNGASSYADRFVVHVREWQAKLDRIGL